MARKHQYGDWISATEAGRMLQVHPQTVKAWAGAGYLVGYQLHPRARHLISLASVERVLDARRRALARLEHATDGTSASVDATKIGANSAREAENGIAVGDGPHKRFGASWFSATRLTWQTP